MTLHHRHAGAAAGELPGGHEAGRARAHHGHARRIRTGRRKLGRATVGPLPVADGALVVVDGLRLVGAAQVAGRLTEGRAHATRELGQRRGERQALGRLVPEPAVDEVIPLGDEVVQRAAARARLAKADAGLAEGHTAHHAAACLHALLLGSEQRVELLEVARALGHRTQAVRTASVLEKRSWLAHATSSP